MSLDANSRRLRVILECFSIPHAAVAEAGKVSPSFISRILCQKDKLVGSSEFYMRIENALPRLIEQRRTQIFDIKAAPTDKIEELQGISRRG